MESVEMLYHEEVGVILDCAVEVHRILGHGLLEKLYENALEREFQLRGISYLQQPRYPVDYKDCRVGEFIPDLVVFEKIIVDTKTIDRITRLRIGFIINYKHRRLETKRVIL
jgi:GxxExxY protein